ncbi:uncharacterized protein TRAVEDRAFT_23368 [Trametes versicolor FP-101664 SS1]|uniref:uncharacterized protein n=1 Tax=Trametes versicolor (strain FP-101664) TaxID=717944 RepID=UPI0004622AB2|nr:uncharacterized protein TRAVEDRAFT_23368 [Trametes versicolor FP-101664 SS1]EIW54192.1 hypothetical protein TRAVEDRAFT_23368 [Trametes versicolor FP-101664 SS1]
MADSRRSVTATSDSARDGESAEPQLPQGSDYNPGDICCVHETMATVAEHILKGSPGIKDDPVLVKQCTDSLFRIYNFALDPSRRLGRARPCVLFTPANRDQQGHYPDNRIYRPGPLICIMATFDGKPPKDRVYLDFMVPVFPNCEEEDGNSPSARPGSGSLRISGPQPWKHEKQLIIAFRYRSPSQVLGTWPLRPNGRKGGSKMSLPSIPDSGVTGPDYWLDREAYAWLVKQCNQRLDEWSAQCEADLTFAPRCAQEYRSTRAAAALEWACHFAAPQSPI